MSHRYSDRCMCDSCSRKWRKALEAALARSEKDEKENAHAK